MNTNRHEPAPLLERDLVFGTVGACFEVVREIGRGPHEKPYENALVIECRRQGVPCERQKRLPVSYKAEQVSEFVTGLTVSGSLILDANVIERITDHQRGQMLNYLRISGIRAGLNVNFRRSKLEWERIVL